ncbi:MAG TPA: AAA family ATPase [Porphyromonadaceae bacterium]|nr:AAA family ATPase [Porphyromonadaceae bacterium]
MENATLELFCVNNQKTYTFPLGISLMEALEEIKLESDLPIVSAKVNRVNKGMDFRIYSPKDVEYLSIKDDAGMRAYIRSLHFIIYKAVKDLFPNGKLILEYPLSEGVFCHIEKEKDADISIDDLQKLKEQVQKIIDEDLTFHFKECKREEAIELFRKKGMEDKVHLLETNANLYLRYYTLGDEADYYYGCLVPSTKYISAFDIVPYGNGFLVLGCDKNNSKKVPSFRFEYKLLSTLQEFDAINRQLGLDTVGKINNAIIEGKSAEIIKVTEALQERKVASIADEIVKREQAKVILISGPSSSGKTTFAKRLAVQLMTQLKKSKPVSMDNYFVDRDFTPLDEEGKPDYESIRAVDMELFTQQVSALLNGEGVYMPKYDFASGQKIFSTKEERLEEDEILLIEGIHCLNPEILKTIPEETKYRIYVSALTTLSLDYHNCITMSDNRLIRRIIRDVKFRKYSVQRTLQWWTEVRKGEKKWIFPFQENADVIFNSALPYELALLKRQAVPALETVPCDSPDYSEVKRLLNLFSYVTPILNDEVPQTSLLREFFGGSSFRY